VDLQHGWRPHPRQDCVTSVQRLIIGRQARWPITHVAIVENPNLPAPPAEWQLFGTQAMA